MREPAIHLRFEYDLSGAVRKAGRLSRNDVLEDGLRRMADAAIKSVRALTPGNGTVRDLWVKREEVDGSGQLQSITIENRFDEPADLLGWLEHGTDPHVIEPKPDNGIQRLVFYWPAVDAVVFARSVDHPGTQPYRMIANTLDILQLQMQQWIRIFERDIQIIAEAS